MELEYTMVEGRRVTLVVDDSPTSPGEWDQPLELVLFERGINKHWGIREESFPVCENCRETLSDHPEGPYHVFYGCDDSIDPRECPNEDCREGYCDSPTVPRNIDSFIIWDSRGPYSTIAVVERDDWRSVVDYGSREVMVGALYPSEDSEVREWWDSLPEVNEEEGNSRARVREAIVEEWSQWANGEVYGLVEEVLEDCGHWEDGDSLWGLYGYEYATSPQALMDTFGYSEELASKLSSNWSGTKRY